MRFHILAVNQIDDHPFNRAALANVGFQVLSDGDRLAGLRPSDRGFDCMAVHDIDRVPVAPEVNNSCERFTRNYYTCPTLTPRVLHPESFTGGVLLFRPSLFRAVNGFSNQFWGWGHEDNELYLRFRACGFPPEHPQELDTCMAHNDCERCKRAKPTGGFEALRAETRGIARVQGRMREPLAFGVHDGLSTLNFTASTTASALSCGGGHHALHVLNVRLHRSGSGEPSGDDSDPHRKTSSHASCVADGSEKDDGCIATVGPSTLPERLVERAKHALPRGAQFLRVVSATRMRAMYNYHYELDIETEAPTRANSFFRIALCAQEWQDPTAPDDARYQLLWRAVRHRHRRAGLSADAPRYRLTTNFSYHGAFPCALGPPLASPLQS